MMRIDRTTCRELELWLVAGSQSLYGQEALTEVSRHVELIARYLDESQRLPVRLLSKGVLKSQEEILQLTRSADADPRCIGLVLWMHTFSPAMMWVAGLKSLAKPFVHLHTQFNRDIPWDRIDMDYMNLHQSAHGGREFGFISSRLGIDRTVIVGHWQDDQVIEELRSWSMVALAWADAQSMRIARFGDNMRDVAVTEGDKLEAQIRFGFSVRGHGVGELVDRVRKVREEEVEKLMESYRELYTFGPGSEDTESIRQAARIELGLKGFLDEGGYSGFTTTFEDLYGLAQLPGLAAQRLMAQGYGFAAEGDWKSAALCRMMWVISLFDERGVSFMEDYTYHFEPDNEMVLGAHMLEVSQSIAASRPSLEVHPLGIGGKSAPARLVFDSPAGKAVNASLIDLGNRFRLVVNTVEAILPEVKLPRLPVARVLWKPQPDLKRSAEAWILAGGAHHTVYSQAVSVRQLEQLCSIAGIEMVLIDDQLDLRSFRKELQHNELYHGRG